MSTQPPYTSVKTTYGGSPYIIFNNQGDIRGPYNLVKPFHILGRDPEKADLILPEEWGVVSRRQACLRKVNNDYYIHDGDCTNFSSNRLFINNTLITPKEGHRLVNGDEITIGQNPKSWVIITYYNPTQTASSPPKERIISLKNRCVLIGRDAQATLSLDSPTVSRKHATIDQDSRGDYILRDFSTNGVFVNEQKVNGAALLPEGATIRIGPYLFLLKGDNLIFADQGDNIRLDVDNLVKLKGGKLQHISLPIEPGEFVAIVGGSGTGKSTLMRTLLGIEATEEGTVYLNGEDLRNNFNIYRNQIGYVPQTDIVHRDLKVSEVLNYAAKLRLSSDMDISEVVKKTLDQIEMTPHQNQLVKNLSGGQLKRVSMGVELLANPKLFFLDEPTSGLDPGLDQKMMKLLRRLADEGRTIILVTHATSNITLGDRLIFLGLEGHLCYFGPPGEAWDFFQVNNQNFADIYLKLENAEQVELQSKNFQNSLYYQKYISNRLIKGELVKNPITPQKIRRSFWEQIVILSQRYSQLILRDKLNLGLSLLTAPLGISLINLAIGEQSPFVGEASANLGPLALRVLFVFTCAAIWIGLFSSLQEIVKETPIYLRERLVNLGLLAYLASKTTVLAALATVQSLLITAVILLGFQPPNSDLFPWFLGVFITCFLTVFTAQNLGLMVSALVKNITQANSALPILLLPQIIFSGVLFTMEGIGKYFSWLMLSRWSIGAYGTLVNVNQMVPETEKLYTFEGLEVEITLPFTGADVYSYNLTNLMLNWGILLLQASIYWGLTFWLQKRKDVL